MSIHAKTHENAVAKKSSEFISEIKKIVQGGGRFTPFLGAGISAQSGILMGQEFPDYIAYSVYRVLGGPDYPTEDEKQPKHLEFWDIRARGWPPYPTSREIDEMYKFFLNQYRKMVAEKWELDEDKTIPERVTIKGLKPVKPSSGFLHSQLADIDLIRVLVPTILRSGKLWETEVKLDEQRRHLRIKDEPSDPNTPSSSMAYILEFALRSLSHWTRTLEFLSKVALAEDQRLYLEDEPDIAVIDSFNAYITRGKKPNLIHNMISRLARSLRSQMVLTTNFDTLVEESYRAQGEPLHVLAVSIKGGLPSYATVRAQDCLIKLHGDILETRADSTINDPPSEKDKRLFFQYLRGPGGPKRDHPFDFIPSNLLVLGYSGGDARCVQMIKFVMDLDPEFRVFWVCHGESDLDTVTKMFCDYMTCRSASDGNAMPPQLTVYQTDRTDLLLWELYQQINLSLPGGGYSVQFSHFVPPISPDKNLSPLVDSTTEELTRWIEDKTKIRPSSEAQDQIVCVDAATGTTLPMQSAFYSLKKKRYDAVWMELEDYRNTDDFFFQVFSIISQRIGQFQLEWTSFVPDCEADGNFKVKDMALRMRLLNEKFKINPAKWCFFLYGRNGAGGCTGWSKEPGDSYWPKPEFDRFEHLLIDMAAAGFRIIYMPHGRNRYKHTQNKAEDISALAKQAANSNLLNDGAIAKTTLLVPEHAKPHVIREDTTLFNRIISKFTIPEKPPFKEMIRHILYDFVLNANQRIKASRALWLYGLTLFRQSRHPSAMISEAVFSCPWRFAENLCDESGTIQADQFCTAISNTLTDNDLMRDWLIYQAKGKECRSAHFDEIDLEGWINFLERAGVFMRKPGGYSWMYRDSRLGLQCLLEKLPALKFFPAPFDRDGGELWVESMRSRRSSLHCWIGDWYLRAYYSTGHYTPLIEAIYHSVQCLEYIDAHKPLQSSDPSTKLSTTKKRERRQKDQNDAFILAWKAVCQLRKLILVGRKSLLFWCPGTSVSNNFFGKRLTTKNRKIEENEFETWRDEIKAKVQKFDQVPRDRKEILNSALNELYIEIRQMDDAVRSEGYSHGGRTAPIISSSSISRDYSEIIKHKTKDVDKGSWSDDMSGQIIEKSGLERKFVGGLKAFAASEWDLSTCQGQIDFSALKKNLLNVCWFHNNTSSAFFDVAWLVSELMYRTARRAKLEYHAAPPKDLLSTPDGVTKKWKTICALGSLGLDLCRMLAPDFHQADCDLRVRILTVYALGLSYLNRFSEASRRFNEAHALIISGMGTPNGRELARIHIRRAEMLIWRAKRQVKKIPISKDATSDDEKKKATLAIVYIDDAWTALERGEIGLGGISKATYWWYRLIALRMSCYAVLGELKEKTGMKNFGHCLPFRRRLHLPSYLTSLLRDGLILGAGDLFRQLRMLDYALEADQLLHKRDKLFGEPDKKVKGQKNKIGSAGFLERQKKHIEQLLADIYRIYKSEIEDGLTKNYWVDICKKLKLYSRFRLAAQEAGKEVERAIRKDVPAKKTPAKKTPAKKTSAKKSRR